MTTYFKRLAIASTNAFARDAPRSKRAGELDSPRRSRINKIIRGVSGRLNDHLFQKSRDRVNQRVCKRRTKEQASGGTGLPSSFFFFVCFFVFLSITISADS